MVLKGSVESGNPGFLCLKCVKVSENFHKNKLFITDWVRKNEENKIEFVSILDILRLREAKIDTALCLN